MGFKIQARRGLKQDLPVLDNGEFGWCHDTSQLYIGSFSGINQLINTNGANALTTFTTGKGDGVTDDTAAFNLAINGLVNGGVLVVPPGTYLINGWATGSTSDYPLGGIKLKSNITIWFLPGAKIKIKTATTDNYAGINITNCSNVKIIGGEILGERATHAVDPNGQWGYGVAIVGSTNVTLEGMLSRDCFGDGYYIGHNVGMGTESKRITLDKCMADNNRRQGLSITGAIDVTIIGGWYANTNGHLPESGIDLEPNPARTVKDVKMLGVNLEGNTGHGLQIGANASGTIVDACIAKNNLNYGFYIGQSNDNTLTDNQAYGNGITGIVLNMANNNIIKGNKSFNNKYHGIMVGQSNDNIIHDNHVYGNSQQANATYDNINVWDSDYNNIQGNIVRAGTNTNKPLYGINISTAACDKNLVINNDCYTGGTSLGLRDVGNFTETTAGNRKKDGTWGNYAG